MPGRSLLDGRVWVFEAWALGLLVGTLMDRVWAWTVGGLLLAVLWLPPAWRRWRR